MTIREIAEMPDILSIVIKFMTVADIANIRLAGLRLSFDPMIPGQQSEEDAIWMAASGFGKHVIDTRFHSDPRIFKNWAKESYDYAAVVLKYARWPAGEAAIATDPRYAMRYVSNIIKGRWPAGEKAIATDPCYAYMYASHIIKGQWPAGEKAIYSDNGYACKYNYEFRHAFFQIDNIENLDKVMTTAEAEKFMTRRAGKQPHMGILDTLKMNLTRIINRK